MTTAYSINLAEEPARLSTRFDAIDSAKGVGIILVVFGHAWRGAMGAGLISDTRLFTLIDYAVYAFHMPLFFFLSGLLFLEGLQKYQTSVLLRAKLTRLLWPMALWTWVFFALKLLAGEAANSPVSWSEFPLVPLPPYEHLWFLWALFLCQSILIVLFRVFPFAVTKQDMRKAAAFGSLALALLSPFIYVPSDLFGPMVEHASYFFAGIAAGAFLLDRYRFWVGLVCAIGFVALSMVVEGEKASVIHSLALIVLWWGAWLATDGLLKGNSQTFGLFRNLGRASMAIYLIHTPFSAATRIVMVAFGFNDPAIVVFVTMLAGLSLPLLVLWGSRKMGVTKLLGF